MPESGPNMDGVSSFKPEQVSKDKQPEPQKKAEKFELTDILSVEEITTLINQEKQKLENNNSEPENSDIDWLSQEEIDKLLDGVGPVSNEEADRILNSADPDSEEEIDEIRKKLGVEEQPKVEEEDEKGYNMAMNEGQPSNAFAERFAKSAEARIEADKLKNTHNNAVDLVSNNVDFFGSNDEEKKSEIALRVLGRFNRGYTDFNSMLEATNNPSKNQRIAHGDIDSLAESVRIAMDMSVLGEDLITDSLSAEEIDDNLPKELKGIGKRIKEKRLTDGAEDELLQINKTIEDDSLLTTQDKVYRGVICKKWNEQANNLPENSYIRKYVKVATSVFETLGVEELKEEVETSHNKNPRHREEEPVIEPESGDDNENGGGWRARFEVSPENAAQAFKFMAGDLRWDSWRPPEWYKNLDDDSQFRIEVMTMICDAAAGMKYAGKDLDKMLGNKVAFEFTNKHMSKLFNHDFKLVTSRMLNDLCETYVDQNGNEVLRYKEVFDPESGKTTIAPRVREKIGKIQSYKEELAMFLAEQNGRSKPNYMDQMNAFTAWNLFYTNGDSSLADRMRILPTYSGIINDSLRTLNPEFKAMGKMQVIKSGSVKDDEALIEAEYFSGNLADYLLKVMRIERDTGRAIDGRKRLRDKLVDRDVTYLSHRTFYGFFDFVNGGRDLFKGDNESTEKFYNGTDESKLSLGKLVMDYGSFDRDGNLISTDKRKEFSFGSGETTFMNEFRDSLEGAIMAYTCLTGKAEIKDPIKWMIGFKDKLGMINGIKFNNDRAFSYTRDPRFWRDILIGSMGYDKGRLSSDHICLKKPEVKPGQPEKPYSLYIHDLLITDFGINNFDFNIGELARLLGVDVKPGEKIDGFGVMLRNNREEVIERARTRQLLSSDRKASVKKEREELRHVDNSMINAVMGIQSDNPEIKRLKSDFDRAVKMGSSGVAEKIYREIMRIK